MVKTSLSYTVTYLNNFKFVLNKQQHITIQLINTTKKNGAPLFRT